MTNATSTQSNYNNSSHVPVVVPRGAKRTKDGGVHKGSRSALIREARRIDPNIAHTGVIEVLYGSRDSINTVVVFDTTWTAKAGLQ